MEVPTALTNDASSTPIFPVDLHGPLLIDGPLALIRRRIDERVDSAAIHQQIFDNAVEELRRRVNARTEGEGGFVQVHGYHFS